MGLGWQSNPQDTEWVPLYDLVPCFCNFMEGFRPGDRDIAFFAPLEAQHLPNDVAFFYLLTHVGHACQPRLGVEVCVDPLDTEKHRAP